jgi:hypothetical protein
MLEGVEVDCVVEILVAQPFIKQIIGVLPLLFSIFKDKSSGKCSYKLLTI